MGVNVGIDLGTTYSAVAWINPQNGQPEIIRDENDNHITPSVVWFRDDGKTVCGAEAYEAYIMREQNTVNAFKRNMGTDEVCCIVNGREYRAEELSSHVLMHLKSIAEKALKQEVTGAVITVPAYFHNQEREATKRAAEKAGLKVLRIINEPTAAALNYGQKSWRENAIIMVYDLGGGTFDVTLVGMGKNGQLESLGTDGDHKLGGKDWDAALADLIIKKLEVETDMSLRNNTELCKIVAAGAEKWKKDLSKTKGSTIVKVPVPGAGITEVEIERAEFDKQTAALLEKTGMRCESVLQTIGLDWENVTDVLLVGGSTRMPQIREYLSQKIGKAPISHVNPDEAVAMGAAIQTQLEKEEYQTFVPASISGRKKEQKIDLLSKYRGEVGAAQPILNLASISKRDVEGHGLGIVAVNTEGTKYINENIIPPNTHIPVKSARKVRLYTSPSGLNEMEIYVLEGEGEPIYCVLNAKYTVTGIRHKDNGTTIRVQYSYDRNGIIHVQARQEDDDCDLPIREERISPDDMDRFAMPIEKKVAIDDKTIVIAVDVSGSMNGKPLRDAKEAMSDFVQKCKGINAKIGVIVVSDRAEWVIHPTDDYRRCEREIQGIKECQTGVCNRGQPFDLIYDEFSHRSGENIAIVMADGLWSDQPTAVKRAKKCHSAGIQVRGLGFGSADKKFLKDISSDESLSIFASSSADLSQSFGKIAQSLGGSSAGHKKDDGVCETWETLDD